MSEYRSGFDIRAMLLSQAQSIHMDNYERMKESVFTHNDLFPNNKKELPAVEISAEDIIATAKELNTFVSEK